MNNKIILSAIFVIIVNLLAAGNASAVTWTTETVDSVGIVGEFTSIALDSSGKAYISYFDYTNYDLKYATNASGSWVTTTVDSPGYVGGFTSIALDSSSKAYISYFDSTNGDLKYATNATSSSAPTVTTGSATSLTASSATLNGTVTAHGLPTTAWFDYGATSGSYTGSSTTQSVSGTSATAVGIGISGLSAGTTYYYRIAAKSSAGTSTGSEASFTTTSVSLISGTVTLNGSGLFGITMTLGGDSSGTTITDEDGNYSFTGLSNGTYTVTPTKDGYTFDPTSRDVTMSDADVTGVDFAASVVVPLIPIPSKGGQK